MLDAVAAHRNVHLYLLHPSPALWRACAERIGSGRRRLPRGDDTTAALPDHAMLRSWGQDSRELQVVLGHPGITGKPAPGDLAPPTTLLHRLQHDIGANRPAILDDAISAGVTSGDDRSIQVHVCHGPRRQVEVLRDAVLHLLAADPTLEARDVVVMSPDLATFAPLIEAAFPAGTRHPVDDALPDLRVRIADRSPAATNPLVRFAATVLDLADSRLEASALRELVTQPAVQQRFGFDAEVAGEIVNVIDDTDVAWGIDGADRERWGAGTNPDRTWRQAMDRALTGVFYSDSPVRVVAGVAPLDGVEGQDATPVGLLAALIDRIAAICGMLGDPQPMSAWAATIATAVRLLAAPGWDEEWQWVQLGRLLTETFPSPAESGPPPPGSDPVPAASGPDPMIGLAEARRAAASWVDDRPSPLHFRTGDVTVCTLLPMRSVPYRVVCLLGMDDDRFPRSSRGDGDDLLVDHEVVGDHDRGSEDRQLLLDAVMAAGGHLVVTYSGHDQLTNAAYPPAVPIAELVDTAAVMVGDEAMASIVIEHPLQSFAARNFMESQLGPAGPWGFDPMQFAGAVAAQDRYTPASPQPVTWPDVDPEPVIELDDLIAFLQHPAGRFAKARLGFSIPEPGDVPDDTLPADLTSLARWAATNRILTALLAGHDVAAVAAGERHSGALPAGALGTDDLDASVDAARSLWDAARARGYAPERQRPWPGSLRIGDRLVEGSVLADADQAQIVTVTPSHLKGKPRLRAFVELAFLTAIEPGIAWTAVLLGRGDGDSHKAVTLLALGGPGRTERQRARLLTDLVALYDEGQGAPLPIPCETAYIWQRRVNNNRTGAMADARDAWGGRFREKGDGAHSLLLDLCRRGLPPRDRLRRLRRPALGADHRPDHREDAVTPRPYDPVEPLGPGRTVVEASAGTGKTFTIAAELTRLVAVEGLDLEEILVVTFTRAATAELRHRVRRRLVDTSKALGGGVADHADAALAALLAAARPTARPSPPASRSPSPASTGPRSSPSTASPPGSSPSSGYGHASPPTWSPTRSTKRCSPRWPVTWSSAASPPTPPVFSRRRPSPRWAARSWPSRTPESSPTQPR